MQLHIGADVSIPLDKILFVLNEKGMTQPTKAFIEKARRERRFTPCAGKAPCRMCKVVCGKRLR